MATPLSIIKNWFRTGMKPTQAQFHAWLDSFWHKDEDINAKMLNGKKDTDFASALQGKKADTAIQGISVNNSSLTSGAGNKVDIPVPRNISELDNDLFYQTEKETLINIVRHNNNGNSHNDIRTQFGNYVPKAGATMTGALELNGAPTTERQAATKQYVDDTVAEVIQNVSPFKGFISSAEPMQDVREGNMWYQTTLQPNDAPDTSFPWQVKNFVNGQWTDDTVDYTPVFDDKWRDADNSETWFYAGNEWERLDFNGSSFDSKYFKTEQGNVSLKEGAITDKDISPNANISQSRISGLVNSLDELNGNLSIKVDGILSNVGRMVLTSDFGDGMVGLEEVYEANFSDLYLMNKGIQLDFKGVGVMRTLKSFIKTVGLNVLNNNSPTGSYIIYGEFDELTTGLPADYIYSTANTHLLFDIKVFEFPTTTHISISGNLFILGRTSNGRYNYYITNTPLLGTSIYYYPLVTPLLSQREPIRTTSNTYVYVLVFNQQLSFVANERLDITSSLLNLDILGTKEFQPKGILSGVIIMNYGIGIDVIPSTTQRRSFVCSEVYFTQSPLKLEIELTKTITIPPSYSVIYLSYVR